MKKALAFLALSLALLAVPLRAAEIPIAGRVLGPGAKPVAKARAVLIPILPSAEAGRLELGGRMDPEPVATAPVAGTGAFLLKAPDAGMWKVRVEAPGFAPLEMSLLPLLEETDLPEARLSPDVRLQVRVTGPQGKPVAGARVRAEDPRASRSPDSWGIPSRLALTDANGSAALPRAQQESLVVRAGTPGWLLAEQKGVRRDSVSLRLDAGRPRQVQVRDSKGTGVGNVLVLWKEGDWPAGRTAENGVLDLTVPPAGGSDLHLVAADGRRLNVRLRPAKPEEKGPATVVLPAPVAAAGKVVSAQDGRPVSGSLVWPSGDAGAAVRTGAGGAFRLAALVDESGSLSAAAPGFFPDDRQGAGGRTSTLALQPRLAASGIVVDEAGRPVAGAALQATFLPSPKLLRSMTVYRSGGFSRSAPSGRFRLSGLLADVAYGLQVSSPGFAPARLELPAREAGQPAPELRIVLRQGRAAFGTVVDGGRRPVAGARVRLLSSAPVDFRKRIRLAAGAAERELETATDAAGRFEVKNLPAGTYDLLVLARGFARLTVPSLALPEGNGATDLGTVMLAPGASVRGVVVDLKGNPVEGAEVRAKGADREELPIFSRDPGPVDAVSAADGTFTVDDRSPGESLDLSVSCPGYGTASVPGVAVPAESPVRIVLSANARVSGRVADPQGKPVPRAFVFLIEKTARSFNGRSVLTSAGRFHDGVTDDDGGFAIADVSPGPIELSVQAPRYQEAELKGLEVKPGQDLTGLDVMLPPGAAVEGKVLSPEGRPIADAEVTLAEASPNEAGSFSPLWATTDSEGQYRIEGVPPGQRTFEARAEGYRRGVRDVEVTPGTRAVDFQLDRGLEVSGRVVDDGGNPVPGADVTLIAGRNYVDAARALSGADGTFRLGGVQDGIYRLITRKEGYTADFQGQPVTVAGAPVSGLEVRLANGATIIGRLSGVEFSQLSRVRITANSPGNPGQVDPEGNYRIPHLAPGTWTVSAAVPDTSLHAEGTVHLEPGVSEARLDLQLGGGHELRGVVLRNGEPLAGAVLFLDKPGSIASAQSGTADYQGAFRFGGLDNGTYELGVSTPNGARHSEKIDLAGDREVRIELHTAALSGRVIDALDSSPVAGAEISLASKELGPLFSNVTTDSRGQFRLLEVGDGAWKLKASREGYAPAEREVQVDGSALDEIEVRMNPTEGVTVEALLASGQPPDRLRVAVLGPDGKTTVASGTYPSGENGRTRLSNVPPGSWQLLVESDQSAPVTVAATVPGPAVRVLLPPPGQLRVQVPAPANDAAAVKVTLLGSGGPFRNIDWSGTVTSEWELRGGTQLFTRVPAGVWQVVARAADGRSWTGTATVTAGGMTEVALK